MATGETRMGAPKALMVGSTRADSAALNDGGSTADRGDVPEPVAIIEDFAAAHDCVRIQGERDFWAGMSDDPDVGVRASAYVLYAETKLAEAGC
jgi:hypothetical protein